MEFFGHPFSSYCWKVQIALYENDTPFTYRQLGPDRPENEAAWTRHWPMKKMPVLVDGDRTVIETDAIIEYLDRVHPGPVRLLPEKTDDAIEVRMLGRIADDYVFTPMNRIVGDALRPEGSHDTLGVEQARRELDTIYAWLDHRLVGRAWTAGDDFTLADCALAPALFYADWAHPIADGFAALKAHRAKLNARPSMARCIDDARPFRAFFPLGAPDRD